MNESDFQMQLRTTLSKIEKSLANIERLLRNSPETSAAILLQMKEILDSQRLQGSSGKKAMDLWNVLPPEKR